MNSPSFAEYLHVSKELMYVFILLILASLLIGLSRSLIRVFGNYYRCGQSIAQDRTVRRYRDPRTAFQGQTRGVRYGAQACQNAGGGGREHHFIAVWRYRRSPRSDIRVHAPDCASHARFDQARSVRHRSDICAAAAQQLLKGFLHIR